MTVTPALHAQEIRMLQAADLDHCVALVARTFDIDAGIVRDWCSKRLLRNPWQETLNCLGIGIWAGTEMVACRLATAQPWAVAGEPVTIAFAAHTCVKQDWQGRGLGRLLIEKSKECAVIVASTSSGVGTQPLYAQADYRTFGQDNDFYRCRVSYGPSLGKRVGKFGAGLIGTLLDWFLPPRQRERELMGRFRFERLQHCDAAFDALWQRARNGYGACLERSSAYLNWRLFECPTCPLQLAGVFDSGGLLRCFAVWHTVRFDSHIRMTVLRDLFAVSDDDEALRAMIGHLFDCWRGEGITWASFEVAHPRLTALFQTLGFEHVPSIGNRYHIHADHELEDHVWSSWFRSGLDGDYFDLPRADFQ